MIFLQGSLYFKHHVEKNLRLEEELPALKGLPDSVPEGLRSILKAVVEEMERREMTSFGLKTAAGESGILLEITAGKGSLSPELIEKLRRSIPEDGPQSISAEQMTAAHAVRMLSRAGLSPEVEEAADETRIRLFLKSTA
ncbi:MAG: hypothetical protein K9M82_05680 [Deltaproteobacteria bacterium]|nr:hypothetical protein [Deltaproteobacteria bacterium]